MARKFSGPPTVRGGETFTPPEAKHTPGSRTKTPEVNPLRGKTHPWFQEPVEGEWVFGSRLVYLDYENNKMVLSRRDRQLNRTFRVEVHMEREVVNLTGPSKEDLSPTDFAYLDHWVVMADRKLMAEMNEARAEADLMEVLVPNHPTPAPVLWSEATVTTGVVGFQRQVITGEIEKRMVEELLNPRWTDHTIFKGPQPI